MFKILVVGGAGYIGSHMVLSLMDNGYSPVILDNLSRGALLIEGVPNIDIDLRDSSSLRSYFTSNKFDAVMHFAGLAYVEESVHNPAAYYENNFVGSFNLLEAIRASSSTPIVFSSTCSTYGEPISIPINELHPRAPINPYGWTKFFVEQMLCDYGKAYEQKSISFRYFNAAGSDDKNRAGEIHEPETHLIPLVLSEAFRIRSGGNPHEGSLKIYGDDFDTEDGTCIRDFIHVSDLCRAHLLGLERLLNGDSETTECYNLSNGVGFSVKQVIDVCRMVTQQDIKYSIEKRRAGDPAILVGDYEKAKECLKWSPRYDDLEKIISTAWKWMMAQNELAKNE